MKQKRFISLLLATTVLTAGCVSSKYDVPDLETELGYSREIKEKYTADTEWWREYGSGELNRLVDLALKNNPDYLKAALNIQKELYSLNIKQSDLFPTLTASLGASSQKRLNRGRDATNNFSGELALNYELDLYGKIRDAKNAQEFELNATVQDRDGAKLSLVNSVVDLYFNLEYLQNTIDLTRQNVSAYREMLNIAEERYQNGKADRLEVAQAQQSLRSEQTTLLNAMTQFKEMEQSLSNVLNVKPDEKPVLNFGVLLDRPTPDINLDVPVAVLANRPDLAAAQYRLKKAFSSMKAEEKNWYPSITLNGAIGSSSQHARSTFDFPYLLGGVSLNLPFLDWNRVKNNVKIAEADYQIAVLDFKDALTQAINELAYYTFAYEQSKRVYDNALKNVQSNAEITAYYRVRYSGGKSEFKDLLAAIRAENTAKKELVQQKYQIIKYENYICKATAGKY